MWIPGLVSEQMSKPSFAVYCQVSSHGSYIRMMHKHAYTNVKINQILNEYYCFYFRYNKPYQTCSGILEWLIEYWPTAISPFGWY